MIKERKQVTKQQQARIQAAKGAVPDDAYDLPIMTLGLPTKVENLLGEAGFANVGELAYRLLLVPSSIGDIDGIGPSYIKQIENALEVMIGYQPLPEELDVEEDLLVEDQSPTAEKEHEDGQEPAAEVEGDIGTEAEIEGEEPGTDEEEPSEKDGEELEPEMEEDPEDLEDDQEGESEAESEAELETEENQETDSEVEEVVEEEIPGDEPISDAEGEQTDLERICRGRGRYRG